MVEIIEPHNGQPSLFKHGLEFSQQVMQIHQRPNHRRGNKILLMPLLARGFFFQVLLMLVFVQLMDRDLANCQHPHVGLRFRSGKHQSLFGNPVHLALDFQTLLLPIQVAPF